MPGGVTQVKEVAAALIRVAKTRNITTVIVGHVTKDGSIAGPRVLEHVVDVVLHFEGDRDSRFRMVRAMKNRFGPVDEVGCFDLGADGITAVTDPTGLFVENHHAMVPGTCVAVTMEGRRPMLAEVQALVTHSAAERPRRTTSGLDSSRVAMVMAVLQQHCQVRLHTHDVFASTVGGARVIEPASDLAVAVALDLGQPRRARPEGVVAMGEIGLSGELRRVRDLPQRLAEAARLGFQLAVVPTEAGRPAARSPRVVDRRRDAGARRARRPLRAAAAAPAPSPSTRSSRPGRASGRAPRLRRQRPRYAAITGEETVEVATERSDETLRLRATLATIAPGTPLRDGLERILRGRTGALIVLGHDKIVESISTGGFTLDVPFTATGLRELAKMDGAIILDKDVTRILRAAVHLMPDHTIPSEETGTRHRTADRVARQTGFPVISVSQSMQIIAAYVGETRHVLEDSGQILSRANQALATLERYKLRLDEVSSTLSALEIEDLVTVRDVAVVAQRLEMVTRIAREIEDYVLELGTDGRLLSLQLEELITGVDTERELVIRDYLPAGRRSKTPEALLNRLESLSSDRAGRPGRRRPRPRARQRRAPRRRGRAARLPAARQGARGCPARSSTGWSTTSAPCRSCSPPASTTCRPSTASASCGPAACARGCPGSPSRRSSSATSSEPATVTARRAVEARLAPTGRRRLDRSTAPAACPTAADSAGWSLGWAARSW